jgi:hypothetical protein
MSRTLLVCLLAVGVAAVFAASDSPGSPWQNDLTPITKAEWNCDRAAHLLECAGFGGTRYVLFPKEIPRPTKKRMDFVADIIGQRAYEQMNEMAKRGDFPSPPGAADEDSGFNRNMAKVETYNIFRGVYNGGIRTFKTLKFDTPTPAKVDTRGILRGDFPTVQVV